MKRTTFLSFTLTICLSSAFLFAAQESPPPAPAPAVTSNSKNPLAWDAIEKQFFGKVGDTTNTFTFWVTNTGPKDVLINNVVPACGCTVAQLPSTPWKLTPGASGPVVATMNFTGKTGDFSKTLTIISSVGQQILTLSVHMPAADELKRRQQNMLIALNDRQAVLKGECASCHVKQGEGKKGEALFAADCAICHDPPPPGHRAEMVTDLTKINHPTDAAFWRAMIAHGKPNTLMPAFAKANDGPLNDEEIESLVEYCVKKFPSQLSATDKPPGTPKPAGGTQ